METIETRTTGNPLASLGRLGAVLQNRGFTLLLLLTSFSGIAGLAFIASSTCIYQDGFHISSQMYSFYFSLNAIGLISGPLLFLRLSRRFHPETIIKACYVATAVAGGLEILFGNRQPWVFALCILPASIAGSCSRPPTAHLLLEQQKGDTGAVSSLMGAAGLLMGSLGLQLVSLPWGNIILALGTLTLGASGLALLLWPWVIQRTQRIPRTG